MPQQSELYISAIVGQVVRCHDGDPDATEMTEYTIARRARVTLNGKRSALANLVEGDAVRFGGQSKEGFREITALRSPESPIPVNAGTPDLGKPRRVRLVEPTEPKLEAQWVNTDTPPEEVGQNSAAVKSQPPKRAGFDERTKHSKVTGDKTAEEGVTSGDTDGDEAGGTETRKGPDGKTIHVTPSRHDAVHAPKTGESKHGSDAKKKG